MGILIPKIVAIWASPVTLTLTLTLTQIAKAICERDAYITRVLGMGPYHCNVGSPKSEGPGNDITPVTLDDPFAASCLLDNQLSLSPSPAKLSHPQNGFT